MVTSSTAPLVAETGFMSIELPIPPHGHAPKDHLGASIDCDTEGEASIGLHMIGPDGLLEPVG